MSAALEQQTGNVYRRLTDEQLGRELQLLERKVIALRWATTAAGTALHVEFSKRLCEVRLEIDRRRT